MYVYGPHTFLPCAPSRRLSASHMAPASRARASYIPTYECVLYCINSSFIENLHLKRILLAYIYDFCIICNTICILYKNQKEFNCEKL